MLDFKYPAHERLIQRLRRSLDRGCLCSQCCRHASIPSPWTNLGLSTPARGRRPSLGPGAHDSILASSAHREKIASAVLLDARFDVQISAEPLNSPQMAALAYKLWRKNTRR